MSLQKVNYVDDETVIYAQNLNDIQNSIIANTSYVTCTTAANLSSKTALLADFVLAVGSAVKVKFSNTNTAANPTLNINGTGAKPIYTNTGASVGTTEDTSWAAGEIVELVYDGTNWVRPAGTLGSIGALADLETTDKTTIVSAINEVLDDVKQGVANNLIPYPYAFTSSSSRGITFVVNDDGSISYSGTPDNSLNPFMTLKYIWLKAGTYTISNDANDQYAGISLYFYDDMAHTIKYTGIYNGLIHGGDDNIYVNTTNTGINGTTSNYYGVAKTFTINSDACCLIQARTINNSYTSAISGTIYPMLERGAIAHDYVPYNDSLGGIRRDIGDLADLETTATSDLVSAINEVNAETDVIDKLNAVVVTTPTITSLPVTFTASQLTFVKGSTITTDLMCGKYDYEATNEDAIVDEIAVSTDTAGQITITGTISGSTALTIYFRHFDVSPPASGVTASYVGMHDIYKLELTNITSLPVTITGLAGITAQHETILEGSGKVTPGSSMGSEWSFTCGDGSITITGTFFGSTSTKVNVTVGIPDNKITVSAT